MEFGLLGPVRALSGGAPIDLGPRKQRLVLAVLLLGAERFVATASLVRACWLDDPPPSAHRVVHAHVSRVRGALAGAGAAEHGVSLTRHGAGYVLVCEPMRVDVHRFRSLVDRARTAGGDEERVALLDEALGLWRGHPWTTWRPMRPVNGCVAGSPRRGWPRWAAPEFLVAVQGEFRDAATLQE
jgi:DNA-binding SARP family transcriptional activator